MREFPLEKLTFSARKGRVPLWKFPLVPKRLYMEERSFRAILAEFLEENEAQTAPVSEEKSTSQGSFFHAPPLLSWEKPDLKIGKKNPYPAPARRAAAKKDGETVMNLGQLTKADQISAQMMIQWGAHELTEGISLSRLKKAHRRLIKALHPDHMDKGLSPSQQQSQHEAFLALQSTYEGLSQALKDYKISGSACGNESASAQAYRRQDAA